MPDNWFAPAGLGHIFPKAVCMYRLGTYIYGRWIVTCWLHNISSSFGARNIGYNKNFKMDVCKGVWPI